MAQDYQPNTKVYATENLGRMSIRDMLAYFEEHGAMRVSDLHIKVGAPPAYRIDGNLAKLKGPKVTPEIAKQLIYPLLSDANVGKFESRRSVDCSYRISSLQFRINVFQENDGICAAIRALSLEIPKVETIGFPNDIWQDIVNRRQGLVLITGITGAGKSTTIASLIDLFHDLAAGGRKRRRILH
ncbi:MAG: ATPase, T2SS/T4P/T4SS family [Planctomycetota bacterium]|jgi:twitching motility protein PilT